MKLDVIKLDGAKAGSLDLDEALFGLEPRADILHRVVRWQRNNAQAGTHKVKDPQRSQLFHKEDLSPKRHRWRTPRRPLGSDLSRGWRLQGSGCAFARPRPDQEVPQAWPQARSVRQNEAAASW